MNPIKIFLFACLLALVRSLFENDLNVNKINLSNYNTIQSGIWLVVFYKHTCSHCQRFAPKFQEAASALRGIVRAAAFDCVSEKPPGLVIPHVPRVKLFVDGKVTSFKGPYTSKAVVEFVVDEFKNVNVCLRSCQLLGSRNQAGHRCHNSRDVS